MAALHLSHSGLAEDLSVRARALEDGELVANGPYEQPVAHIADVALVRACPSSGEAVHVVVPHELFSGCEGVLKDEADDFLEGGEVNSSFDEALKIAGELGVELCLEPAR